MKNLTLKVAIVAVAMFAGLNGSAQNTGSVGATGWLANTTVGDYVSTAGNKITAGKTMPFWVWPSAAYNPAFDYSSIVTFAPKATIITGVTSSFAWSATGTAPVVTNVAADKNYATILWPVADVGPQTISVTETPSSGVCAGDPVTFAVDVINIPSVTIPVVAGAPGATYGLTNLITSACWKALNDNLTAIPFTINNAAEVYPYHFHLDYKIYTVSNLTAGAFPVTAGDLNTGDATVTPFAYDNKVNGVVAGVPNKTTNPIKITAGANLLQAAAVDFEPKNGKITVYEFDLLGYNAKVSRTSDYGVLTAGNVALYDTYSKYGTAAKYYIVAFPAPITGPIYHIANTFGL